MTDATPVSYSDGVRTMRARRTKRRAITITALFAVAGIPLAACSDDDTPTVETVEDDFPGDAFDAACALLERTESDDRQTTLDAVLDALIERAGEETAVNTLELAVADRCPDWQDELDEALADRSD